VITEKLIERISTISLTYLLISIVCQAFNWESHKHNWWSNLEGRVADIAKSGFTAAWLPPPTQSLSQEGKLVSSSPLLLLSKATCRKYGLMCFSTGYLPQNLYSLDSCYGSLQQLNSLIQNMNDHNIRAMADVVINHRVGTTQGSNGMYNRYDGIPVPWDEHAVTSCSGGKVTILTCPTPRVRINYLAHQCGKKNGAALALYNQWLKHRN
jgi:alpha-amylase